MNRYTTSPQHEIIIKKIGTRQSCIQVKQLAKRAIASTAHKLVSK